jgi:hypothetical protein
MAVIIISKTQIIDGGKIAEVKNLRVCTRVDRRGVAVASAWRDATENLLINDAKDQLVAKGYTITQDFWRVTNLGKGKANRTRIIRFFKDPLAEETHSEPIHAEPPATEPEAPARKTRKPRKVKNSEQLEQQTA